MHRKRRHWSELEKYQLWIAYQLKTPLKVMAQCLEKKPSAINHALKRYDIRPPGFKTTGPHTAKSKQAIKFAKPPKTCRQLGAILKKCDLLPKEDENIMYWSPICPMDKEQRIYLSKKATAYLERLKIAPAPPWQLPPSKPRVTLSQNDLHSHTISIFQARQETARAHAHFPEVTQAQRQQRLKLAQSVFMWVSFYDVVEYLKINGIMVQRANARFIQADASLSCILNGKLMTQAQVLVRANKIRLKKGQEPFLVKSVSQT